MAKAKLHFRFDLEKLVAALGYFAESVTDLTKLKAAKLLYFADQYHLFRYGRPVIGDSYVAMDLGPVPESAYQFIGRLTSPDEVDDPGRALATKWLWIQDRDAELRPLRYPVIRSRQAPDLGALSESDIEALRAVLTKHGQKSATDLVTLTHQHRAWIQANASRSKGSSVPLPYEAFFEDASEMQRSQGLTLAELGQEDRDFAERFTRAGGATKGTLANPVDH